MSSQPPPPNPFGDRPSVPPVAPLQGMPHDSGAARDSYNIVSDTVVGMNLRKSDNLFQLIVVLVCLLVGVVGGAIAGGLLADLDKRLAGVVVGAFAAGFVGVILGLLGSGIYLMIYRAVRHLKGKHD